MGGGNSKGDKPVTIKANAAAQPSGSS